MNKIKYALLAALFLMPMSATLLHNKIHPNISWIAYITLFDAIIVTILMARKQTTEYGFYLNSLLALTGLYHFFMKTDAGILTAIMTGLTDVMFVVVDFLIGFSLYALIKEKLTSPAQTTI